MASIVDQLNDLLVRERGEVEAVHELMEEITASEPDIAESASDALDTAEWSCHGLYHRIVHLGGAPTLESASLAETLTEEPDTRSKVALICKEQSHDLELISKLLRNKELDSDTRAFLDDLLRAHQDTKAWCDSTLSQWRVER